MKRLALQMTGAEDTCSDQEDLATTQSLKDTLLRKCLRMKILTEIVWPKERSNAICTIRCVRIF